MKKVENMETGAVIAYPEGDLWVLECNVHGFMGISTNSTVDIVLVAHMTHAHSEVAA